MRKSASIQRNKLHEKNLKENSLNLNILKENSEVEVEVESENVLGECSGNVREEKMQVIRQRRDDLLLFVLSKYIILSFIHLIIHPFIYDFFFYIYCSLFIFTFTFLLLSIQPLSNIKY